MLSVIFLPTASGSFKERYRGRALHIGESAGYYISWGRWNQGSTPIPVGAQAQLLSAGGALLQDTVLQWRLVKAGESITFNSQTVKAFVQGQLYVGYAGDLS